MPAKQYTKLYITYIDYQKAYDRVDRRGFLPFLDRGNTFLEALNNSLTATGVIGDHAFPTSRGVKQGGSTSCKLFTAYIDPTIDAVKSFGPDDWLNDIHLLLLMDDTVVFATLRQSMQ